MANLHGIKYAILVHQLPLYCEVEALDLLPKEHIVKVEHDEMGLKIYFNEYNSARECILIRIIRIRNVPYTICPLATNLTLHGILKYASKSKIRTAMSSLGLVVDLYPVEVVTTDGNSKTTSLTDDYRIILDVPEVHMDFKVLPLVLPDFPNLSFRISFFCRLCRCNGHMQHQCSRFIPSLQQKPQLSQHCPGGNTPFPEAGCSTNRPGCSIYQQGSDELKEEKPPLKHKQPKRNEQSRETVLSRLVPPGANLKIIKRLLRAVLFNEPAKITQKDERKLEKLLDWNRGRDQGQLNEEEKKFIKWLELYLVKVRQKSERGGGPKERHASQTVNATGVFPLKDVDKKSSSKRKRAVSLSPGVEEIVLKTTGKLSPPMLRNFLNQVRGRKTQLQIASHFTTDFPSLFIQLEKVVKSYYTHGRRGPKEDADISFIKRLRERMMKRHASKDKAAIINEQSSFEGLSFNDKGLPKTSVSKTVKIRGFTNQNEADKSVLTKLEDRRESPSEFKKSDSRKRRSSGNPIFAAQSCIAESREEKLKLNLERSLSLSPDVQYFTGSSSSRNFITEEGPSRSFQRIGQRHFSEESPSRRIENDRKRCSSVEDSPENFQMKYAFCKGLPTTNSSYTRRYSSDSDSIGNFDWDFKGDLPVSRSSYTTQSSTHEDSLESFRSDFERTSFFEMKTEGEPSDGRRQSSFDTKFPEISKEDLRKILSCVKQTSENISSERGPGTVNIKKE